MSRCLRLVRFAFKAAIAFAVLFCGTAAVGNAAMVETHYGGKIEIDPATFRIFDVPNEHFEQVTGLPLSVQAEQLPLGQMTKKSPAATGKVLTILVDWANHPASQFINSPAAFTTLLYSDNVHPTGSVNDYYQEVSYGAFNVTGQVVGWVRIPGSYSPNYNIATILSLANPLVNYADFDGDGDGFVDALWIVHAGPGQEETHNTADIWSHAVRGANVTAGDGVRVDRWSVQPEMHYNDEMISIRVFCHEYGHILGLPDLYDYDGKLDTVTYFTPNDENDHPMQDWDVMGYNGYNIMAYGTCDCPSHFSAWSRMMLGWINPVVPECLGGSYQLYNIEENNAQSVFKVPISDDGLEYFLLEYRNPRSSAQFDHLNADYSAYCPWFEFGRDTLDAGLLVTHIDESVYPNDGLPSWPNYGVAVVDAGYNPSQPWNGTEHTEWWYPYEFQNGALFSPDDPGQTALNATTSPNSHGYDGPSGVSITVTGQNANYMTILIDKPVAPTIQSVAPIDLHVGDSIAVGLFASDLNCTFPGLSTGTLPPFVIFTDSGNGHGSLTFEPTASDLGPWTIIVNATDDTHLASTNAYINVAPALCDCACHADAECNASPTVTDVVAVITRAFRNGDPVNDATCPPHGTTVDGRTDVDCTGNTDIVDLVKMVDVAFRNADPATKFCDPCL